MAYFLGKDNPGDLASVLTGAYNLSSPSAALPSINAESTRPLNQTTTPQAQEPVSKSVSGQPCYKYCMEKGYRDGTQEFDACFDGCIAKGGPGHQCSDANPCQPGFTCVNGECVPEGGGGGGTTPPTAECPESGPAYEGCSCGKGWATLTGNCPPGYVFVKKNDASSYDLGYKQGAIGQCECQKWISDGTKGKLGEYKYPAEMQSLMDLLLSRGKEFLGLAPGFSQEAQDKMFGRGFESVRGQEAGQRTALESGLSRQGMLGTGAGQGMLNDLAWQTEGNVANLARDLFIANEEKKKADLLDYTTGAQSVMSGGLGFEQLREAINSARRGEGAAALQNWLAWLLAQMG